MVYPITVRNRCHGLLPGGFSLVELMITLAVFSVLMGAVLGFFASQRDTYRAEELSLERDQNLRMAVEAIFREFSSAGYRAADPAFVERLPLWAPLSHVPAYPLSVTLNANPKITLGEGPIPDVFTFAGSVSTGTNPTTLSEDSGGTSLTVSLSNSDAERQFRVGDIICIGYLPEYAVIVEIDGNALAIDGDPEISGSQPLSAAYPAGTPLEEISIVSYAVFNDDNDPACERHEAGYPLLKRKINAAGFYPVADNILQMKVTPTDGGLQVSLTGRADPVPGSAVAETTLVTRVALRNDLSAGFATDCIPPAAPGSLVLEGGLDESYPCQILLSWEPVIADASGESLADAGCPVTGYRIFSDSIPGGSGSHVDVPASDAAGYLLDVSAVSSSVVYICVAAENSGGLGERSPEAAIADTTPPEAPVGLVAGVAGATVVLSWDQNSECDLAGYYLYRQKDGDPFELAAGLISPGGGYSDTGLSAGASYTYRLAAVDAGFNASGVSASVTVTVP